MVCCSYLLNKGVVFAGDDTNSILLLEANVDVDDVEAEEEVITVYTNGSSQGYRNSA